MLDQEVQCYGTAGPSVNQSSGVPQQWQHQTECCTPVDYRGNQSGEAAGPKGLAAAQLAMLNL